MVLMVRGIQPSSVFRLNGADENSASFALGWVLEQSLNFRDVFTKAVFGATLDVADVVITLQKHGADRGFTDVEIQAGQRFHAILEAKRWWNVPAIKQLERYQSRLVAGGAKRQRLVSVSAADVKQAQRQLPNDIGGVQVTHISWGDLQRLAKKSRAQASGFEEKLWLRDFIQHLQEFVIMDRLTDNKVFVVSLGRQPMVKGKKHTWIDVVERDGCYFHPVGNGWPVQPPNYIGFRYNGKLQSVHHIDSFEIVVNLAKHNPLWPKSTSDRFVYRLGPPMRPPSEVKTGKLYMNGRVWCAIDTLLSGAFPTISDARDETKRRSTKEL